MALSGAQAAGSGPQPHEAVPDNGDGMAGGLPPRQAPPSGAHTAEAPGVIDALSDTLASARTALSQMLELLSLEARRAGLALLWMLFWGTLAAIFVVTAWLGLVAAVATWAMSFGMSPIVVLAAVAVINLAVGIGLMYLCFDISRDLLFTATRRQVSGQSTPKVTRS